MTFGMFSSAGSITVTTTHTGGPVARVTISWDEYQELLHAKRALKRNQERCRVLLQKLHIHKWSVVHRDAGNWYLMIKKGKEVLEMTGILEKAMGREEEEEAEEEREKGEDKVEEEDKE